MTKKQLIGKSDKSVVVKALRKTTNNTNSLNKMDRKVSILPNVCQFQCYEKMHNSYNLEAICDTEKLDPNIQYVATEKIHGTNYSFLTNGTEIFPCRRHGMLDAEEKFNNQQTIFQKYNASAIVLFNKIKAIHPLVTYIQLYGELFGGLYNNKTAKGAMKIQSNTNYHPENEFMAYDIRVNLRNNNSFFLDWVKLVSLISDDVTVKFKLVPVTATGKLNELLNLNPVFESVVSAAYGFQRTSKVFHAEGVVIRPIFESTMPIKIKNIDKVAIDFNVEKKNI
jgi:Rnl2 family RNA ligase